jgi:hypothetical protein
MLWQGAKWRILKNFNVQNEECHNYAFIKDFVLHQFLLGNFGFSMQCQLKWKKLHQPITLGLWDDLNDLMFTMPKVNALSEFIIQAIAHDDWLFERQ